MTCKCNISISTCAQSWWEGSEPWWSSLWGWSEPAGGSWSGSANQPKASDHDDGDHNYDDQTLASQSCVETDKICVHYIFHFSFFILQKSAKNNVQYILQRDEALAVLDGHLFLDCLVKPILCISFIIIIMIAMMIMIHQTRAVWLGPEQLPNRCQSLAQRSHHVHTEKHED